METSRKSRLALVTLLVGLTTGCAGGTPSGALTADQLAATTGNDQQQAGPYQNLAKEFPNAKIVAPGSQASQLPALPATEFGEGPSTLDKIGGAFKTAGRRVSDVFTLKSEGVATNDAISLSNTPAKVPAIVYTRAGQLKERQGDVASALDQYQRALQAEPKNFEALVAMARLQDRLGKFGEATVLYRRAAEVQGNEPSVWNDLGLCYARQGDIESALTSLDRAIQLAPQRTLYRNNIATVLVEAGQPDPAFGHLAAVHPQAVAHYNLGFLLHRRQQDQLALQHLAYATQLDGTLVAADKLAQRITGSAGPAPMNVAGNQPAPQVYREPSYPDVRMSQRVPPVEGQPAARLR